MRSRILAIVLLLLAARAIAQPTREPQPGRYAYLQIRHQQQSPDLCLTTCVAMALDYYGDEERSQWTVKRLSNEHRDLFSATTAREAQLAASKLGYAWDRVFWRGDSTGFQNAVHGIELALDHRQPVIIEILTTSFSGRRHSGHALLVFGYDEDAQEIMVLDPARAFPGKRHIPFSELRTIWHRQGRYSSLFTAAKGEYPVSHRHSGSEDDEE